MGRSLIKFLVLMAVFLSGGSVFNFYSMTYEPNDVSEPVIILIEKGEPLGTIALRLKKEGLISSVPVFKGLARFSGKAGQLKAGEYRIPPRSSMREILDVLNSGLTTVRRITIPEGKTSSQIYEMLLQTPGLFGELGDAPANGTLLPETYVYSYGLPRKVVVKRMTDAMTKTIDELWPKRQEDLPYKTKKEALVMASIVEKETALPAERPRIAGVFVNRLRKGMRLQTDPTVIYAVTDGTMELKRRLTFKDLKLNHPFNTYVNKGLPPEPICNPGRESIAAALNPMTTNELYFVADGTGGHAFSKNFSDHQKNIAAWKKARYAKKMERRRARLAAIRAKEALKKGASAKGKKKSTAVSAPEPVKPEIPDSADLAAEDDTLSEPEDISLDIVDLAGQTPDNNP